jgi:hypothetical protein
MVCWVSIEAQAHDGKYSPAIRPRWERSRDAGRLGGMLDNWEGDGILLPTHCASN